MDKRRRRQVRSAELDSERSDQLRKGGPAAHASAVHLGRKGGRKGGSKAHRVGGLARVKASRSKGGKSKSPAKVEAARQNAQKARDVRLARAKARKLWEEAVPTDSKPKQTDLFEA